MQTILRLLVVFSVWLSSQGPVASQEPGGFSITFEKPSKGFERILGSAWWIYLSGEIDGESASKFESFLNSNHVPIRSHVVLNSPGGSLYGGMELGRVIRKHRLNTDVGVRVSGKERSYKGGECYSSCTYAYMGGVFRYLTENSHFGVHRFFSSSPGYGNMDTAQITSAQIVGYLREMGVDPEFFSLTTKAGASDVYEPPRATLEKLLVVNNGTTATVWSVESKGGALYLKGERNTQFGAQKLILLCSGSGTDHLILHVMIEPQGHEEELMGMQSHSLVINSNPQPIEPLRKSVENGWFNATYAIDMNQISEFMTAKTVGVVIRANEFAPMFLGFDYMPTEGAAEKLIGIKNACSP